MIKLRPYSNLLMRPSNEMVYETCFLRAGFRELMNVYCKNDYQANKFQMQKRKSSDTLLKKISRNKSKNKDHHKFLA